MTSQRVPKIVNGNALENRDEGACDGEADDEMVTPEEDAPELEDRKDAVLEKDAAVPFR